MEENVTQDARERALLVVRIELHVEETGIDAHGIVAGEVQDPPFRQFPPESHPARCAELAGDDVRCAVDTLQRCASGAGGVDRPIETCQREEQPEILVLVEEPYPVEEMFERRYVVIGGKRHGISHMRVP